MINYIIVFIVSLILLKLASMLFKFKNKTWKTAAIVSIVSTVVFFVMIGFIKGAIGWIVSLLVPIFLIKYTYKEKWPTSILMMVCIALVYIIILFILITVAGYAGWDVSF